MSDWGEGYVTATDYTTNFFVTLAPESMDHVALFLGKRPARREASFRYFELGCGTGLTTILLAALHPEAEFAANDFNPGHVAIANDIIAALGLTNITIKDTSFAEALAEEHEPYDYIVSHGVYTWVSQENRELVAEFIGKNLKVGGYSVLSYNCAAGWSQHDILNVIFKSLIQGRDTSDPELSREIIGEINQLFSVDEGVLQSAGATVEFMERLKLDKHDPRYIMHEFGNEAWEPVYSHQAINHMASKKLDFIGHSDLMNNTPMTGIPAKIQGMLAGRPKLQREMLVDMALARSFRSDLYVKGAINKTPGVKRADFDATRFFTKFQAEQYPATMEVLTGDISLDEGACHKILGRPRTAGCTGKELREFCAGMGVVDEDFDEFIQILSAVGYLLKEAETPAPQDRIDQINKTLCAMSLDGLRSINYLLSPRTRRAEKVNLFDQLFFHIGETKDLASLKQKAVEEIQARRINISGPDGQPLTGQRLDDIVHEHADSYLNQRVAAFKALHIIPADA